MIRSSLTRQGGDVLVSPPDSIRGKLEVRGIGIIRVPAVASAKLVLVADLVPAGSYERLPDPGQAIDLLGVRFPLVEIAPFEVSAALKLLLALRQAGHCLSRSLKNKGENRLLRRRTVVSLRPLWR